MSTDGLMQTTIPFIMMGCYILIVFFLSWRTVRKNRRRAAENGTFEDFYTGGKSMNSLTVALITVVTFYSGTTFTGRVGFYYNFGVVGLTSIFTSTFAGVVMYFLSEKIWPLSKKYHLSTLSDLLEFRYQSQVIKTMTAVIIVCFNMVWLVSEIRTLGLTVNVASGGGISQTVGSALMFGIIIFYVCTGGVHSVAAVDSFSAAVMVGGSLVVLCAIVGSFFGGNPFEMMREGANAAPELLTIAQGNAYSYPYWISNVVLGSIVMLVYPSNYMSICLAKSVRAVKRSSLITAVSGLWLVIYAVIAMAALGLSARGIAIQNPEGALLEMTSYLRSGLLLGLVTTFILAASMGTLDSTLLSLSALLSNDVVWNLGRMRRKEPCIGISSSQCAEREHRGLGGISEVSLTRLLVVLLGITAYMLSLSELPLLVLLVNYAMSGLVQIVPATVLGLYWKKSTPAAALISMPLGVISMLLLDYYAKNIYVSPDGSPFFGGFMVALIALALNAAAFVLISLATSRKYYSGRKDRREICEAFFTENRAEWS